MSEEQYAKTFEPAPPRTSAAFDGDVFHNPIGEPNFHPDLDSVSEFAFFEGLLVAAAVGGSIGVIVIMVLAHLRGG